MKARFILSVAEGKLKTDVDSPCFRDGLNSLEGTILRVINNSNK